MSVCRCTVGSFDFASAHCCSAGPFSCPRMSVRVCSDLSHTESSAERFEVQAADVFMQPNSMKKSRQRPPVKQLLVRSGD